MIQTISMRCRKIDTSPVHCEQEQGSSRTETDLHTSTRAFRVWPIHVDPSTMTLSLIGTLVQPHFSVFN